MSSTVARPLWKGRGLAIAGIVLLAFSLRTAVASLSPVLDRVEADFDLPAVVLSLIATAPPVCFAIFGILTPAIEKRLGLERLAAIAMIVCALGLVARGLSTNASTLLASTAVVFAAVGVGNILLPPLVKKYFPDRIGLMMTVYTTALAVSTFIPPLFAVPVADAAGWRIQVAMWAVFAIAAIVPWFALSARQRGAGEVVEAADGRAFARMWRLPLPWALMTVFAVSSSLAYVAFAWLPLMLTELSGVDHAAAGALLALFSAIGLPLSLVVPVLVVRFEATLPLFLVAIATGLAGFAGLLWAPRSLPWLWVTLLGVCTLLFPLILVLLGLRARTHTGAVALSGFVQSVGYAISAVFPFAIGVLHESTGGWTIPILVVAVQLLIAVPAGLIAARTHTVEDEWERRHGLW